MLSLAKITPRMVGVQRGTTPLTVAAPTLRTENRRDSALLAQQVRREVAEG